MNRRNWHFTLSLRGCFHIDSFFSEEHGILYTMKMASKWEKKGKRGKSEGCFWAFIKNISAKVIVSLCKKIRRKLKSVLALTKPIGLIRQKQWLLPELLFWCFLPRNSKALIRSVAIQTGRWTSAFVWLQLWCSALRDQKRGGLTPAGAMPAGTWEHSADEGVSHKQIHAAVHHTDPTQVPRRSLVVARGDEAITHPRFSPTL